MFVFVGGTNGNTVELGVSGTGALIYSWYLFMSTGFTPVQTYFKKRDGSCDIDDCSFWSF